MSRECAVSVVIATRNRATVLEETLQRFVQVAPRDSWELVVIDNGSSDGTAAVVARFADRLPLRALVEKAPGKARAVNRGLDTAAGRLVLFTDDDITVCREWIAELTRAARDWAAVSVFCGPIVPRFPAETPAWLRGHAFAAPAFGRFTPVLPEGPLPEPLVPFGSNFGLRASAADGVRLNEALGPAEESLMSEDTEFLRRLRARGEEILFVPTAGVIHRLRPDHVTIPALFARAFALGRSVIVEYGRPLSIDLAAADGVRPAPDVASFERGAQINFYFGQLYQLVARSDHDQAAVVRALLTSLQWIAHRDLLTPAAASWSRERPALFAMQADEERIVRGGMPQPAGSDWR